MKSDIGMPPGESSKPRCVIGMGFDRMDTTCSSGPCRQEQGVDTTVCANVNGDGSWRDRFLDQAYDLVLPPSGFCSPQPRTETGIDIVNRPLDHVHEAVPFRTLTRSHEPLGARCPVRA